MNIEEKLNKFINNAIIAHKNKYDYSKVIYNTSKSKVIIGCKIHGDFLQSPEVHLKTSGCPKCANIKRIKSRSYSQEEILKRANEIHKEKYIYSRVKYVNILKKVEIICQQHGSFFQTMNDHVNGGSGCPRCAELLIGDRDRMSKNEFINRCKNTHGNKYDYSNINYENMHKKITIICPKHGAFLQQAQAHIKGSGCPICMSSKGELKIESFLSNYNIHYIPQHTFVDCKGKKRILPFDFYLPEKNLLIEYDGYHHYFPQYGEERLKERKRLDRIKTDYAFKNNINLLRIHFSKFSEIDVILAKTLF